MGDDRRSPLGLAVFAGGFLVVVAAHPDRFGGWSLWALSPLFAYFVYLLSFRGPPARTRLHVASAVAGGYAVVFGVTAWLGDESHRVVGQAVYLFLPALGLIALLVCIPILELVGAIFIARSVSTTRPPTFDPLPARPAFLLAGALLGAWTVVTLAGWANPEVVVSGYDGKPVAVARVRCVGEDTYLSTPKVRMQSDGLSLQVTNDSTDDIWLEYEIDGGSGGGGAELAAPGVSSHAIRMPASSIGVACTKRGNGTASAHATMAVLSQPSRRTVEPRG